MKPTIFILGDSWGCGEWTINHSIEHLGLEQFFIDDGYTVINKSKPAGSNNDSILMLENIFQTMYKAGDYIFLILTEATRSFGRHFKHLRAELDKHNGLFELQLHVLNKDLESLNQLAEQYNSTIHLIGGLASIPDSTKQFINLNKLVKSWPKLLVGDADWPMWTNKKEIYKQYKEMDFDHFGFWGQWTIDDILINDWLTLSRSLPFSMELSEKIINQLSELDSGRLIIENHPVFQPDKAHPNREGHKILFNYIKENLRL
jgi:hypothetical protein